MAIQPGLIASSMQAGSSVVGSNLSERLAEFIQLARQQQGTTERTAISAGMTPGGKPGVKIGGQEYKKTPVDMTQFQGLLDGAEGSTSVTVKPTTGVSITKSTKADKKMTMAEAMNQASLITQRDKDLQMGMMEQYSPDAKAALAKVQQDRVAEMLTGWMEQGLIDIPKLGKGKESPGAIKTDVAGQEKIRVRLKVTVGAHKAGTEGTILVSEFDPNVHEKV